MVVSATMTEPKKQTQPSTASDQADWVTTWAWRRMYLALDDAGDKQTLRMAAQLAAGLATSYADRPLAEDSASQSRSSVRSGALYAAFVHAVDSLRHSGRPGDAAVCHLIRKLHDISPDGFKSVGQNNRGRGGVKPYAPRAHRPHTE
jgi:hypothetical protein